jgi:hypothetical protein
VPLEKSYQHPKVCTCIFIICIIVMRIIVGGRNLFAEVMDQEGSQCIQRKNTLEVNTLGLIVIIVIPLTYISKFFYITSRCCSRDNIP